MRCSGVPHFVGNSKNFVDVGRLKPAWSPSLTPSAESIIRAINGIEDTVFAEYRLLLVTSFPLCTARVCAVYDSATRWAWALAAACSVAWAAILPTCLRAVRLAAMSLAVVRAMVWAPAPKTEPGMKVRAKSNRSQASWPAVTLLRYEEVAAAGLWMKEARPWPWAAAQVRTPTAPIASAKVEPADISNITHSAVTSS